LRGRVAAVLRWWSSAVVLLVRHRVDLAMLWLSDVLGFGWVVEGMRRDCGVRETDQMQAFKAGEEGIR
jgi:hypothetical protein